MVRKKIAEKTHQRFPCWKISTITATVCFNLGRTIRIFIVHINYSRTNWACTSKIYPVGNNQITTLDFSKGTKPLFLEMEIKIYNMIQNWFSFQDTSIKIQYVNGAHTSPFKKCTSFLFLSSVSYGAQRSYFPLKKHNRNAEMYNYKKNMQNAI